MLTSRLTSKTSELARNCSSRRTVERLHGSPVEKLSAADRVHVRPERLGVELDLLVKEDGEQTSLFNRVNDQLLEHVDVLDFRRLDSRDGTLQITYYINCYDPQTLNDLVDDLKRHLPIYEVSFIQQDQVLGG